MDGGGDYKTKIAQIAAAGNKPEDWKEYIDTIKLRTQWMDEARRNRNLSYLYYNAFKAIPDTCKTKTYAELLIDYADFKSQQDQTEAEKMLAYGRKTLRRFAIIHVACAELELKRGNKEKAESILKRATCLGAEPLGVIKSAIRRLNEGKTRLLSDGAQENNTDHSLSPGESSDEWSNSHFSGSLGMNQDNLRQALPSCKSNTQEVQQDLDILTQFQTATSASMSLNCPANTELQEDVNSHGLLKSPEPPKLLSLKFLDLGKEESRHPQGNSKSSLTSSHSNAIPETPLGQRLFSGISENSLTKRTLHSYHSTPDMRPSFDSAIKSSISKFRPVNLGLPRRVRVDPALKKLHDEDDEHDTQNVTVSAFEALDCPSKPASSMILTHSEPINPAFVGSEYSGIKAVSGPHHIALVRPTDQSNTCSTSTSTNHISPPTVSSTNSSSAHQNEPGSKQSSLSSISSGTQDHLEQLSKSHSYHPSMTEEKYTSDTAQRNEMLTKNAQSNKLSEPYLSKKLPLSESSLMNRIIPEENGSSQPSETVKPLQCLGSTKSQSSNILSVSGTQSMSSAMSQGSSGVPAISDFYDREVKAESTRELLAKQQQMIQQQQQLVQQLVKQQQSGSGSATYSVHDQQIVVRNQITPAKTDISSGQKTIQVNGKSYTVMRLVGRGGSAKVYQVYDPESSTIRALKSVDLSCQNEVILQGYMNEIALLKKLQHCDRVIRLYDSQYVEASKKLLAVLEYGETDLCKFISQNERNQQSIHPITIYYFWFQMVSAVNAMHKEGVIHSDLKPANFILVSGEVKLIDFGIANSLQQDCTSVMKENKVGTPSYMSPEALMAISASPTDPKPKYKVGVRSDVWSLGCILYQMVYGHTPFQHMRLDAKQAAIVNPNYAIPFPDKGDSALMDVLKKCLTRDVRQRPTTDELLAHPYLQKLNTANEVPKPSLATTLSLLETALTRASPRTQKALKKCQEVLSSVDKNHE